MLTVLIVVLVLGGGAAMGVYIWLQRKLAAAYGARSSRMVRLHVQLPKKEGAADKEKETTHDYKEVLAAFEQVLASLHGIYDAKMSRYRDGQEVFGFEIAVLPQAEEKQEVEFFVLVLPEYRDLVERQIRALLQDADIAEEKGTICGEGLTVTSSFMSQKSGKWYPVKTYKDLQSDPMNALINVLSQVQQGEGAVFQMLLTSAGTGFAREASKVQRSLEKGEGEPNFFSAFKTKGKEQASASPQDQERAKAVGEKVGKPAFCVKGRFVTALKTTSADALHKSFGAALSQFERPLVNSYTVNASDGATAEGYRTMNYWGGGSEMVLGSDEMAGLFHFPDHRFNQSPGIKWLTFRKVGAPPNTPREGIQLGTNDYQGVVTPIHILRDDRTRHFYCIGKSGSGKSTLLEYMIKQDIRNGEGVCVIDPHGDLAEAVLPYIPKERAKDVVYFNPGDLERPAGLNLLEADPDRRDFITGQALEIFIKLFGEEVFSPRLQHYFRNACLTLMDDEEEGGTLIEIPRLFIDDAFQKAKVAKVKNPVVRAFWEKEIANTGDREKQEMIPYLTSKFGQFITDSTVRNVIGQTKSAFDFREAMDQQKIVLVNLSKGVIGERNMSLLGMILVTKVQMAAMSRFNQKAEDRKDFYLYVDEFQNFATDSFGSILSEARKYRLNLIVAHQYTKQLKDEIKNAVFGNVGSMMCFKVGAEDAEYLSKEYAPVYGQDDIVNIPNYKAYIKLCINNATSQAFSMNTVWDKEGKNAALGEKMRQLSRLTYGRKREFVDEETRRRAGGE